MGEQELLVIEWSKLTSRPEQTKRIFNER